jgi:hypothetical protein
MVRIFLDSGSEVSLIRRDLTSRMGLSGPSHQLSLTGVGGIILPTTQERLITFRLRSLKGDFQSSPICVITKEMLTDKI